MPARLRHKREFPVIAIQLQMFIRVAYIIAIALAKTIVAVVVVFAAVVAVNPLFLSLPQYLLLLLTYLYPTNFRYNCFSDLDPAASRRHG